MKNLIEILIPSFVVSGALFYLLSFIVNSASAKNKEMAKELCCIFRHSVGILSVLAAILFLVFFAIK